MRGGIGRHDNSTEVLAVENGLLHTEDGKDRNFELTLMVNQLFIPVVIGCAVVLAERNSASLSPEENSTANRGYSRSRSGIHALRDVVCLLEDDAVIFTKSNVQNGSLLPFPPFRAAACHHAEQTISSPANDGLQGSALRAAWLYVLSD